MDSNNASTEPTSPAAAATETTTTTAHVIHINSSGTDSSSTVTNDLRENSSLSAEPATASHIPNGVQMASAASNQPEISSTRPELNYSLPNARPPGTLNVNQGFEYDSPKDSKDVDPPSYEEAIKAMEYYKQNPVRQIIPDNSDHLQYHYYPDNGQFGVQDQHFYPHTYQSCSNTSDSEIELSKSICARLVFTMVLVGFAALTVRMIFFMK